MNIALLIYFYVTKDSRLFVLCYKEDRFSFLISSHGLGIVHKDTLKIILFVESMIGEIIDLLT